MKKNEVRMLTAIKPTGYLHIGNYIGTIRQLLENSQRQDIDKVFLFIADIHALNTIKDAQILNVYSYNMLASLLSFDINLEKTVLFRQSSIAAHSELAIILMNITNKSLINKAHAYKAAMAENIKLSKDPDCGISTGLYFYPILMAADILLYKPTIVPVGKDQRQHIEIAIDIAKKFNALYSETFLIPEYDAKAPGPEIVGLDGRKMSKSYANTIELFSSEDILRNTINKIKTDSSPHDQSKDLNSPLFQIYKHFATKSQIIQIEQKLTNGTISYKELKGMLFEIINQELKPAREKYKYFMSNRELLNKILKDHIEIAKYEAELTLKEVKYKVGLRESFLI
jgi:tryptophanyl-tRNA synthetase